MLDTFKDKNNIPIVLCSDNNYIKYLSVTLESIISNSSKKNNYDIIILENQVEDSTKEKLLLQIKKQDNFSIRFVNIEHYIKEHNINDFFANVHVSVGAYYRIFIPDILSNYDKAIYIDCDLVVLKDLKKLYNCDLKGKSLGVIRDNSFKLMVEQGYSYVNQNPTISLQEYLQDILEINDVENYFNSGVLLMNLKKMRKKNFLNKFIKVLERVKAPLYWDQCIFNSLLQNDVEYLSKTFNFTTNPFFPNNIDNYDDIVIMHYVSHRKPWNASDVPHKEKWWKYVSKSPFCKDIEKEYEKIIKKEKVKIIPYKEISFNLFAIKKFKYENTNKVTLYILNIPIMSKEKSFPYNEKKLIIKVLGLTLLKKHKMKLW